MSRQVKQNNKYELAYGLDHMFGIFIQVFDLSKKDEEDEGIIVDLDEWDDKSLTVEKVVKIAEEYGFDLRYEMEDAVVNID
jgi:hypothetical protein